MHIIHCLKHPADIRVASIATCIVMPVSEISTPVFL